MDLPEPLTKTDTAAQVRVFSVKTGLLKRLEDADGRTSKRIVHHRPKYRLVAVKFGDGPWVKVKRGFMTNSGRKIPQTG
jgi:hypothetical protein